MMSDTRPTPAADARAAVIEAKLARALGRVQALIDLLETLDGMGKLSIDDELMLDDLREIVAEARA